MTDYFLYKHSFDSYFNTTWKYYNASSKLTRKHYCTDIYLCSSKTSLWYCFLWLLSHGFGVLSLHACLHSVFYWAVYISIIQTYVIHTVNGQILWHIAFVPTCIFMQHSEITCLTKSSETIFKTFPSFDGALINTNIVSPGDYLKSDSKDISNTTKYLHFK